MPNPTRARGQSSAPGTACRATINLRHTTRETMPCGTYLRFEAALGAPVVFGTPKTKAAAQKTRYSVLGTRYWRLVFAVCCRSLRCLLPDRGTRVNVEYTGRQYEITPQIRKQVEHGLTKLTRILGDSFEAKVIPTAAKYRHIADTSLT